MVCWITCELVPILSALSLVAAACVTRLPWNVDCCCVFGAHPDGGRNVTRPWTAVITIRHSSTVLQKFQRIGSFRSFSRRRLKLGRGEVLGNVARFPANSI